ncbi:MAG: YfhO family protein [Acidobacteria bacterium]|nr:YfhO family protein [Acidobacteriota bacterium]
MTTTPSLLVLEPLLFLLGALLLAAAVRWWRPQVSRRAALAYVVLVAAFFAAPLFTGALQVPTDLAYRWWLPWREGAPRVPPVNSLLSDTLLEQIPFHAQTRRRLLALEAPLWSHEMGAGQPLLGNAQSAPFAPLHLMALPLPTVRALSVSAAWEILLALLLTHALLLELGAGELGAAFGAVAAGLSTYAIVWSYDTLGMTAAWIPGVLLGLVLLRHGERGGFAGLVVCAVGMAASGHPETMAYAALAAGMVTVALMIGPAPGRWRFAARLLAAGALAGCLAAPVILPAVAELPRSERMEQVRHFEDRMQPPPFTALNALPLIDPLVFGSPRDRNWGGAANFNETGSGYAGLVALAAALAGAIVFRGRIAAILFGGLVALLAALRIFPFYDLIHALPALGDAATGRLRLFWTLAVAIAGGLSVGRLAADRRGRIAGAVALVLAMAGLTAWQPQPGFPWEQAWWIATFAGAAVALATLLVPRTRRWFALVALATLTIDLFLLEMRYQPVVPATQDLSPPPALAFVIERMRTSPEPFRVISYGDLTSNLASYYGLWDPRGYDPMHPAGSSRFVRRRLLPEDNVQRRSAEDYLGIRYCLTHHRQYLPPPWQPAFNDVGGRIWENPAALPLFFMPRSFQRLPDEDQVWNLIQSWHAFHDFRALGVAAGRSGAPVPQQGTVTSIRAGSNRFDLETESATGGIVVSSVTYVPGWRVEMDDRRSPAFQVNSGFLGFQVPPGRHAVHLLYRPVEWTMGLALFGLGVLAALIGGAVSWGRLAKRSP